MRALVTGITGQDGGYLAERLLSESYEVHGLVHDGDAAVADLLARCPSVTLHSGDLQSGPSLAAAVAAADPDEIYNLAGISSVAFSWEQPVLTADITALGAARLLDEARLLQERRGRPVRFVQASSAEIFGNVGGVQDESTPLAPTSPYGAAKAYAHQLCGLYRSVGVFAVSMVLFNHESPRRPPTFVTRKITQTVALIAQGKASALVLGNLDARRDWGWAPDYVDAMVRAARASTADDYVVATGEAHSVRDFALAAFARVGITDGADRIRVDSALVRPGDPPVLVGDATRARTVLGWAPTVTFEELVGRMVDADLP
ncbi:MAG: NAD-dependent epimerase/dehydratase [Frankiales bacterium]|nr:NAD-dependent epimerase/dehydratase [Frankiales bacterium]